MTDQTAFASAPLSFAPDDPGAIPIHIVSPASLDHVLSGLPETARTWARTHGASGAIGECLCLPDATGALAAVLVGEGAPGARARQRFAPSIAASRLPEGCYRVATSGDTLPDQFALGWLMESYRYARYKPAEDPKARLVAPEGVDAARLERIANAERLARDLVNTPAADMGPDQIEEAVRRLADDHGARVEVTTGDDLLAANLPLIHAVGRAGPQAPRLIDMRWGSGPALTLVGKGVAFDTGGLNLKPGASMGLMKKDMGGAANVLALAQAIMGSNWPVSLRVLIPAVENSVASNAFRPGDVLTARNGLTVEVNNTDAEGRLVLADALALAAEDRPDQLVSMATLTGAARVAVGPDIAPFYTDQDRVAGAITAAAERAADPVWRMPFHAPYEPMIEPAIADLDNAPKGGMAGSITAALFLRRFAGDAPYTHFDIYAWMPTAAPGRLAGGTGQGWRALFDALPEVL
ncbi:MAG: leucyl aminopeptidase [Rhodobacterales bacterium]|nr:MAG: leucyl aminopeptidase [Rhodobacterales bacterium]